MSYTESYAIKTVRYIHHDIMHGIKAQLNFKINLVYFFLMDVGMQVIKLKLTTSATNQQTRVLYNSRQTSAKPMNEQASERIHFTASHFTGKRRHKTATTMQ
jgi:hypothetical protein